MRSNVLRNMIGWLSLASLLACSGGDGGGEESSPGVTVGCIQGVVINGITFERVPLPDAADKGLQVLVRDDLRAAANVISDPAADPRLAGEYYLCDVPLDESFPLFVWVDGFLPFEGEVEVHSTAASRSPLATADLVKPYPTEIANIRIYPKNTQVKDLEVVVTNNGAYLEGATVILRAQGSNFLDPFYTGFLAPKNTRAPTQTATTDGAGKVVFPAAELVLGGTYVYTVLPPEGGTKQQATAGSFTVGLRSELDQSEPYRINVDLAHTLGELTLLSQSTDSQDPNPKGIVTLFFNRAIEIVPGTEDSPLATLSGQVTAALADNVAGDKKPNTVTVGIEANKMTLTPAFKTQPDKDTTKEPDLAVSYSGITVRPASSPDTLTTLPVSATVQFYR